MPVDNDLYDRLGETWWDEDSPLNVLHGSLTPGRLAYFRDVIARRLPGGPAGLRALDVGCGGGFLAEELARLGCRVVGVDPSSVSIGTARRHAAAAGLQIDYRIGTGERLPVEDEVFDLVCCCDVLEHVRDVDAVLAETARVMRPGALYLFDTINRTLASKLFAIKLVQEWRLTRVVDADIHDWSMFIRPEELIDKAQRHGLRVEEIAGLAPRSRNPRWLLSLARARRRRAGYGELSRRLDFGRVRTTAISYMGFATTPGGTDPQSSRGPAEAAGS